jgi:hypothetical protein
VVHAVSSAELAEMLKLINTALVHLARLTSLALLGEKHQYAKLDRASQIVSFIEGAIELESFLDRYYRIRPTAVSWSTELHPEAAGILSDGKLDNYRLTTEIEALIDATLHATSQMAEAVASVPLFAPEAALLARVTERLPRLNASHEPRVLSKCLQTTTLRTATKVLDGPSEVYLDPVFTPAYSLLDKSAPGFSDSIVEVVPYFWTLSIRESMAAELCALSIAEYDGLPLAFYRDMAKQAWDEMRHACYCLETAIALLPELESALDEGDPLLTSMRLFKEHGKGLPVPHERNLYQFAVNATLIERLVILHHETETPAIPVLKQKLNSEFCRNHPNVASGLELFMRDEVSHSRIGNTWFRHLLPNAVEREEAIENARLLRNLLLLTSFAHYQGNTLSRMLATIG